jgi:DNA helicase-2/ATP-dependent DNA helicase PcrA
VDAETGPDAVRVMTVHSAKGLEFPYVFLVELTEQRFPTIERKDPIAIPDALVKEAVPEGDIHAEEERRLFYVGITRAQDGVFFSSAKDYGGARVKKPSRFLAELGLAKEPKEKKRGAAAPAELPLPAAAQKNKPPAALRKPGREPRYSFTSLSKYADCPLKYKFAFVLKVPTKGSYHFSFGTSMHNTLYQFLTQLKDRESAKQADLFGDTEKKPAKTGKKGHALSVSEDELLQMYEKNFVEEWYESRAHRDEYFAKGKEALKDFYAAYATLQPNPIALEQGFTVRVADHTIRGKIDRVDAEKKATHIIDYKTGKPKKELTKEDKRQLLLYALAVKDPHVMGNDVDRVTYYYLEDGSQLSLEPTPADYEDVAEWVESVAEGVEAERFEPTPGFVCRMCEFKEICDFADRNA